MKPARIFIFGLIAVTAVAWIAFLLTERSDSFNSNEQVVESSDNIEVEKPRHSANELTQRLDELIKNRGGLPAEIGLRDAVTDEQKEYLAQELQFQQETPVQAAQEARKRLAEIEAAITTSRDNTELERLKRKRKLVQQILQKLEAMGK